MVNFAFHGKVITNNLGNTVVVRYAYSFNTLNLMFNARAFISDARLRTPRVTVMKHTSRVLHCNNVSVVTV